MLVRTIVVHHQMHLQVGWNVVLEVLQEGQKFLLTMPRFALPDDRAVGDIERREQRGRAMSKVIMGGTLDITEPHRQNRLTAFQCLALAFFVHAQNQGIIGWIQVQTDNIAHLVDEEAIGLEFERTAAMGLDPKQREIPVNGTLRGRARKRTGAPMGRVLRLLAQRLSHQARNLIVVIRPPTMTRRQAIQSGDPVGDIPATPIRDRRIGHIELSGNRAIRQPIGCHHDGLCAPCQRMRQTARPRVTIEDLVFLRAQFNRKGSGSTGNHRLAPA